jgi:hypothetical protein
VGLHVFQKFVAFWSATITQALKLNVFWDFCKNNHTMITVKLPTLTPLGACSKYEPPN